MKRVLALDLATVTGWAYNSLGHDRPFYGSQRISFKDAPLGRFLVDYEAWLLDMTAVCGAEIVVFEAPWVGRDTHQNTARKLMGVACVTELVVTRLGLRCFEENVGTVRKQFGVNPRLPRGEAKAAVMKACKLRGWAVEDDNEADALALLDYAVHKLRSVEKGWPSGPLFAKGRKRA